MGELEIVDDVPVEEAEGYLRAKMTTFLGDPGSDWFSRYVAAVKNVWQEDRIRGARADGRWVATLANRKLRLTVPGTRGSTDEIAADGLTGVTVAATHRRQGLLTRMLTDALQEAADRGDAVSILFAAEWPIYGRYGYAPAERFAGYTLQPRRRGGTVERDGKGAVRQVEEAEYADAAEAVFNAARRQRAGNIDRPREWWSLHLGVDGVAWIGDGRRPVLLVHETDGRADGILAWRATRDFTLSGDLGAVEVEDLHATSPAAYRGLFAYLTGLDVIEEINFERRPIDEPVRWLLGDGRALRQTYTGDGLWLRMLDVSKALSARRYAVEGTVGIEVVDADGAGFAAGTYRLDGGPNGADCRPGTGADIRLSQRALAAVYLGGHSLRSLAITGWIDELTPGALDRVDAMFATSRPPWCATMF